MKTPVPDLQLPSASKSLPDATVFSRRCCLTLYSPDLLILHPLYPFATFDPRRASVHVGMFTCPVALPSFRASLPHSHRRPPVSAVRLSKTHDDGDKQLRGSELQHHRFVVSFPLAYRRIPEIPKTLTLSTPLSY